MPPDMRISHPTHQPPQRRVSPWAYDQVPVVGHQTVGKQVHRVALHALGKHAFEGVVVALFVEQPHTAVAAIEDVEDHSCFNRTSSVAVHRCCVFSTKDVA